MKGIVFSSDFVVDSNGNERLLEINTDTAFLADAISLVDFTEFFDVLTQNNITKLNVVYKEEIHKPFVDYLESQVSSSAQFITAFDRNVIAETNIFPTIPIEDSDTFVLRLAYDESAILDSEYAKGTLELLKLFVDNNDTGSVCEFYHSSSLEGAYNTLEYSINDSNSVPDFVVKTIVERRNQGLFYKLGNPELSAEDRINDFIETIGSDGGMIQKYHYNTASINEDNKITSYRSFKIVYGGNLDLISLLDYQIEAIFDLPTNLSSEIVSNKIDNQLSTKHYYEFATNFTKTPLKVKGGILGTHEILMDDESVKEIQNVVVGDRVKSYFISGSPIRDNAEAVFNWSNSGSSLPSGSYTTSSFVENVFTSSVENNIINEIKIGSDTIYSSLSNTFLVYQSDTDSMVYKKALKINPATDLFINNQGNTITIDENNLYVLDEDTHKVVEIDVEDVDTYLIAGLDNFLNTTFIITHNYCFIKGTKITLEDGSQKNIEDVVVGDKILSYNEVTQTNEPSVVGDLKQHEESNIVKLEFNSDITITTTSEHPFFVLEKGWVKAKDLVIGDNTLNVNGTKTELKSIQVETESQSVYNLLSVAPHHNFYANNILVHNK